MLKASNKGAISHNKKNGYGIGLKLSPLLLMAGKQESLILVSNLLKESRHLWNPGTGRFCFLRKEGGGGRIFQTISEGASRSWYTAADGRSEKAYWRHKRT